MSVRLPVPFIEPTKGKVDDWNTELLFFETTQKSPNASASTAVTADMSDDDESDFKVKHTSVCRNSVSASDLNFFPETPKSRKIRVKKVPAPSKSCGDLSKGKLRKQDLPAIASQEAGPQDSPFILTLLEKETEFRMEQRSKVAAASTRKKKSKSLEATETEGGTEVDDEPKTLKKDKHSTKEDRHHREKSLKTKGHSSETRRSRSRTRAPLRKSKSKLVPEHAEKAEENHSSFSKEEIPADALDSVNPVEQPDDNHHSSQPGLKTQAPSTTRRSRSRTKVPSKKVKSKSVHDKGEHLDHQNIKNEETPAADSDSTNLVDIQDNRKPRSSSKAPLKKTKSTVALYPIIGSKAHDDRINKGEVPVATTNSEEDSTRVLSAKDKIQMLFLEQRKKERAARLELAKERIRQQQVAGKPEHERRQAVYDWYKRLSGPTRESLKHTIQGMLQCDVTVDDVDLLPWSPDGTHVVAKKMIALQASTMPAP